jgi:hypothetical protein
MEAKMDSYQEKMDDGQEEMKAQVGSPNSRIVANQEEMRARVSAIQYEEEVTIKCSQEETEVATHSIRSELEEIKHWVEDVLACVDKRTQGHFKELNEKRRCTYRY